MDIGERQRTLSLWSVQLLAEPQMGLFASKKDLRLYDLYHLVYEPTWLRQAHDHVAANRGSITAGCDGINMAKFDENLEVNLRELAEELKTQTFRPHPVRRVYIPKKNGKLRPLGIPSIRDRIVQESLRMVLEPIFEAEFYEHSYGFRPNRSTIDALATVTHRAGNKGRYFWVIEGDIESYFDTIHHRKLMELLRRRIRDKKLLTLVWRFLRAGVMEGKLFKDTTSGTPQGGIVSPLLANVYLHELDTLMARYTSLSPEARRTRRQHGMANFVHVRYADDFVVMCNGRREDAEATKRKLHGFLAEELKLTLSNEKTKITHIEDGFRFLGYGIRRGMTGIGVKLPKLLIPQDALKKFRAKVFAITARSSSMHSVNAKIHALNMYLRGWGNYYRYAYGAPRVFAKLDSFVFWRLAHWLGTKFKSQIPRVMRRFYRRVEGVKTLTTDQTALFLLSSLTFEHPHVKKFANPYATPSPPLARAEEFGSRPAWFGNEPRPGTLDMRPLVMARDHWTCQHCGVAVTDATGRFDHIIPVRRFKHAVDATRLENLQTLCVPCHNQKTAHGD